MKILIILLLTLTSCSAIDTYVDNITECIDQCTEYCIERENT